MIKLNSKQFKNPITGTFEGIFSGNGEGVTGVVTASYSVTSSYASNAELLDGKDSLYFTSTGSFNSFTSSYYQDSASFSSSISSNKDNIQLLSTYTGSYTTTGSNTFNGNQTISGSLNVIGSDYTNTSASFDTRILENSASITLLSGSYLFSSGGFSTRISTLENFSSSLNATFASVDQLNSATASLSSSIAILSSSYLESSQSFNTNIQSLIDATSSYIVNSQTGSFVTTESFHNFTSSYTTASFTGSYTGDGGGLTNIPASGIVGLNLSQVATGSVSASVNVGSTIFSIENAGSNLLTISNVGVVLVSQSINIGRAEDGDYTDGLYTDITPATTVGTMVDRFNEILKGLSPAPAPDLDNFESITLGTNSLRLAFGAAQSTSSYENVTGTGSLSAVDFTQQFNQSTGTGGGRLRLGTFAATTTLTIRLNEDVNADGSPFVNYPANAFNVPAAGGESYTLEINGNTYTETTTGTGSLSGTYFTLTSGSTGFFPATGLSFNIFYNRTGTVAIPAVLWRNGWNFVRVRQGTNVTNFVDWVYDPAAASGNFPYSFNGFTTASVSPTGEKALSGIKYYTGFSYNVTGSISNYYKNVYNISAKSFSSLTSGLSAGTLSIPTPTTPEDIIQVNSTHTFAVSGQRLLSQSLSSTLSITNDFSKTGTTGAITTPTILLDNINTANTTIAENFCLEDRRVPSASYDTQISATNAIGTFASASALGSSDLAVYTGTLRYPTQVLNSGNVAGAGVVYAIAGQPNYSGATGTRYFYRVFTNGASQLAGWSITINGTNTSFVSFGTALTSNNMRIGIKVPGTTGYRDMLTAAPGAGTYTPSDDGVGCQSGGAISLGVAGAISLVSERLPANQVFVLRLEVSSSWVGTISSISITGF